jgi:hypothetical protein
MNRWVVIALALMATVVVGRHIQRLGTSSSPDEAQHPADIGSLGVQVAHAEPLPPVESGGASRDDGAPVESGEPVLEGGALGVPEVVPQSETLAAEPEPQARQRVPLNPEPALSERDRPRSTSRTQGPLTSVDPHRMLFDPGEKPSRRAPQREASAAARRAPAPTQGPVSDVDPHQMLFEPGERPPQGWVRKTPVEPLVPKVQGPEESAPDTAAEPPLEPGADAQTKARIMKRLLRVMELAGEKP